jgi:hypothetical protein
VPQSIGDAFGMMALAFKPGAAAEIDVAFQFNISRDHETVKCMCG